MTSVSSDTPYQLVNSFGTKSIGFLGGVALLINNITGPGMVVFPSIFQQAGWFTVILALLGVMVLSGICGLMIIECMALIPGNHNFEKRVEYTSLAKYYLPRLPYIMVQCFYQLSLVCNNMVMIIQSVKVVDIAIVAIFGSTCAFPEFYPDFHFYCGNSDASNNQPFSDDQIVLSVGFFVTALLCLPMGFFNLDDNIIVQKGAFMSVIAIVLTWVGICSDQGLETSRLPSFGSMYSNVLGAVVFNFAVITSLPSWVNEKTEDVSIKKTFLFSLPIAVSIFIFLGLFGGLAFDPWYDTDSSLTLLDKINGTGSVIAKISFYVFPVIVNLTSIPVFAIMIRYNLIENGLCGVKLANFIAVVLPWLICIPFYNGDGFSRLINWCGMIVTSVVNFIVPPIIYILATHRHHHFSKAELLKLQQEQEQEQEQEEQRHHHPSYGKAHTNSIEKDITYLLASSPSKSQSNDVNSSTLLCDVEIKPMVVVPGSSSAMHPSDDDENSEKCCRIYSFEQTSASVSNLDSDENCLENKFYAFPKFFWPHRLTICYCIIGLMSVMCITTLVLQGIYGD